MTYEPPVGRETMSSPVDVGDPLTRLHWRQDAYKGKVVDFCLSVQVRFDTESPWQDIYRVDTSHGSVHDHVITPDGKERVTFRNEIPVMGWDHVNRAWDEWLDRMMEEWQTHRARWDHARDQ